MRKTILVVDGAQSFLLYIELILVRLGYRVLKSRSGAEGLGLAQAHKPDLVMTEVELPGLDGLALCRALRDDRETLQVPVIIVTTDGRRETEAKARLNGCRAYLTKPIQIRSLYEALEDHLEMRRRRHMRIPAAVQVTIRDRDQSIAGETLTFGEGGMFLRTRQAYAVGTVLDLTVTLPSHSTPLPLRGEVIHAVEPVPGERGTGIKFLDISPQVRSILSAFVENTLTAAPSP